MHFLIVHSKLYFVVLISSWAFKPWFQFILQCVELLCSFGKFWSLMHMKTEGENLSNLGQTKFFFGACDYCTRKPSIGWICKNGLRLFI